ncbi:MAG: hypothetical protein ACRECA_04415 [Pseudolabrys sp.]
MNRSTFKLASWQEFADVNARPLFNEDRKPSPPKADGGLDAGKPIPKLNVTLSGVVITRKARMVMIRENGKSETTTVREGGALSGDLDAWSLFRVEPRKAIFKNAAGEETEVELIATGGGQKPPLPAASGSPLHPIGPGHRGAPVAESQRFKPGEKASTELQRRIEARRQQLREESTRLAPPMQPPAQRHE